VTLTSRLALAAAAGLLWLAPAPAQAHPFGPPQTAEVSTDDGRVLMQWRFGASDDLSALAASLGALPPERVLLDGVVLFTEGDDALLAAAPAFAAYAETHLRAERGGEPCAGTMRPADDLLDDGATVAFDCPAGSGPVRVSVDMLTDLHPAYRTLATGPAGQRAVYAADAVAHDWALGETTAEASPTAPASAAAAGLGASAALQLGGVLLGLAVASGLGVLLWRRTRSHGRTV